MLEIAKEISRESWWTENPNEAIGLGTWWAPTMGNLNEQWTATQWVEPWVQTMDFLPTEPDWAVEA